MGSITSINIGYNLFIIKWRCEDWEGLPTAAGKENVKDIKKKSFQAWVEDAVSSSGELLSTQDIDDASSAIMTLLSILGTMSGGGDSSGDDDNDEDNLKYYLPMLPPRSTSKKKRNVIDSTTTTTTEIKTTIKQ